MPDEGMSVLKVNQLPRAAYFDEHVWVDLIELWCLRHPDGVVSKDYVVDRIRERLDLGETDVSDKDSEESPIKLNDKWEYRLATWFRHCNYREEIFGEFYPFFLAEDGDEIHLQDDVTYKQKLYIYLLLASNLRYMDKSCWKNITDDFEVMSKDVLENQLPSSAKVYLFSSKNPDVDSFFEGNAFTKIKKLASLLGETLLLKEDSIASQSSGDAGLDLVGWVPAGDNESGLLIVLAQCACTYEEWGKKQASVTPQNWMQKMSFRHPPNSMTFTPLCQRKADGRWHGDGEIYTILIDRVRFIKLIDEDYEQLRTLASRNYVDWVLENKEELV